MCKSLVLLLLLCYSATAATPEGTDLFENKIRPLGVAVVMEATHLCMAMRGVEKQNSVTVTSAMLGVFHHDARTRSEFLELIRYRAGSTPAREPVSLGIGCVPE